LRYTKEVEKRQSNAATVHGHAMSGGLRVDLESPLDSIAYLIALKACQQDKKAVNSEESALVDADLPW
jgi:hypothetical protein